MADKKNPPPDGSSDTAKATTTGGDAGTTDGADAAPEAFPVVGLGASAGGLQALKSFFAAVPDDSGIAYIVVVHLPADKPSVMPELLQREANIPVAAAEDGRRLAPDHVYVVPPDHEIRLKDTTIRFAQSKRDGPQHTIDRFFRSLADDQGIRSAAIVLSGTGTDGSVGIRDVKGVGGLVIAQSEETAQHAAMPRSAMDTGDVDRVLAPEQMPETLERYFSRYIAVVEAADKAEDQRQEWLDRIFKLLQSETGHDFSHYKANTLLRRIGRRMGLHQIDDNQAYLALLREEADERRALFREMLIGVTSFFRDRESFAVLKEQVLPNLIAPLADDETLRVWVPGCSTGEEVYSLAMVLIECVEKADKRVRLQLFGTDVNRRAIQKAREGCYPESIAGDVSPQRLKRFFTKDGSVYHIRKDIRERTVFSEQDVLQDPPFSKLHLLCCRNLLIYLKPDAQKRVLPLFHYTLVPEGILMLGSSEAIGGFSNLFNTVDNRWKIFRRREVPPSTQPPLNFPTPEAKKARPQKGARPAGAAGQNQFGHPVQTALLEAFTPVAVLVDDEGRIQYVQGRTGKYLETGTGTPSHNIVDMARPGLRIEMSSALREAVNENRAVVRRRIGVRTNGEVQIIDLHVRPQTEPSDLKGMYLVVFVDVDAPAVSADADGQGKNGSERDRRIEELEKELQNTRESHQSTIEELESSNEELKSTNEELQSSNEELQSSNEELESSKEELQSLNEELHTVNTELQNKVDELSKAHDDMRNLLDSTEIATVFVDNDMKIKRFTTGAGEIFNLIDSDIDRPLQHITSNLDHDSLLDDLSRVLDKLIPEEREVRTQDGVWLKMRIIPYRTRNKRIDGAVLTFVSIDEQKKAQATAGSVFELNPDALAVIDRDGRIILVNRVFRRLFDLAKDAAVGADFFQLRDSRLKDTGLKDRLKTAMQRKESFEAADLEIDGRHFTVKGQFLPEASGHPNRLFFTFRERGESG